MTIPDPVAHPLDHVLSIGRPEDLALTVGSVNFSYAAMDNYVGQVAAALLARGLAPGERVASWLPKTLLACVLPLATARAGLVHVPVNPALKPPQLAHILADSGASLLVTHVARVGLLSGDDRTGCPVITEANLMQQAETLPAMPRSHEDPSHLCALLYTSGSTGRPKGVMLSHENLWLGAVSVAHYLGLRRDDRILAVLPLSFDYGQNQLFSAWMAGGHAVALDYFVPRDVVRAVRAHRITTLAGVPPLWTQLCELDWPKEATGPLRRLTNSGGALSVSLVRQLRTLFPAADVYAMYGLTEAFRSTYLAPDLLDQNPTAMGRAIPFAEVMIVQADGKEAPVGVAGELVHAGPLVAQGYWRNDVATSLRFRAAPSWSVLGGRAVWSGDSVRRDENGLLHFVGRSDEMIKSSGNRISPTEIEEAALACGGVFEAAAFGIKDERLGHAIVLAVRGDERGHAALAQHLKAALPGFMQPRQIHWLEALPRNPNGKIDRAGMRAMFDQADNV